MIPSSPMLISPGSRPPTPVDLTPAYEAWLLQRMYVHFDWLREELAKTARRPADILENKVYKEMLARLVEAERTLPVTGWIVEKADGIEEVR